MCQHGILGPRDQQNHRTAGHGQGLIPCDKTSPENRGPASPIAQGYQRLCGAIRIFAFIAQLAIRKEIYKIMLKGISGI